MKRLSINELLDSILSLTRELYAYERKYGLASDDFYELFRQGRLDDGEPELTEEFCLWAGLYETKKDREQALSRASRAFMQQLAASAVDGRVRLTPSSAVTP